MGLICVFVLLLFTVRTTTGENTFERMERLSNELLNIEEEIRKIQFDRYDEMSFHDSGSGIEVTDWDEKVDAIGEEYGIPEKEISRLRLAKKMNQRDAKEYKYKISEEKKGEFKYLQIEARKDNGLMSYMLVGIQIDFKIKPVLQSKTIMDLFFNDNEYSRDGELEIRLEDYFLCKAQLSAELHYMFNDKFSDTWKDISCEL